MKYVMLCMMMWTIGCVKAQEFQALDEGSHRFDIQLSAVLHRAQTRHDRIFGLKIQQEEFSSAQKYQENYALTADFVRKLINIKKLDLESRFHKRIDFGKVLEGSMYTAGGFALLGLMSAIPDVGNTLVDYAPELLMALVVLPRNVVCIKNGLMNRTWIQNSLLLLQHIENNIGNS